MDKTFHLAEVNIARMRYAQDDPRFQSFLDLIQPINAMAERMEGFVWRYIDVEDINQDQYSQIFDDPRIITNLSVWRDVESLFTFTYKTVHAKVMARRKEWFSAIEESHMALWWVPAGHEPNFEEAKARLDHLETHGPSPFAFSFGQPFTCEGTPIEQTWPKKDYA